MPDGLGLWRGMSAYTSAMRLLLLALLCVSAIAGDSVNLDQIRFSDGISRSRGDLGPYTGLVVYFCGHCPGARATMKTEIKAMHDRIEKERLPVQLICLTPDKDPSKLAAMQAELGLTYAWVGFDPANTLKISLNNILQYYTLHSGGKSSNGWGDTAKLATAGSWRLAVDGLTDDRVKTVWWLAERGRAGAGQALSQGLKSPVKEECEKILTAIRTRRDGQVAQAPGIEAYEALEASATAWAGLDAKELKPVKDRLAALAKDPALKDELAARLAWFKIQALLADSNPKKQETGKAGLAELAKRYPATKYGKMAQ